MNIVISGGTSSGRTTLLGVLSSFVSTQERVITIEDAAELRLVQPPMVGLEARRDLSGDGPARGRAVGVNATSASVPMRHVLPSLANLTTARA
jgi:type IV secretory pathway ATPase VirB11/archaellum biosynthesis ATPase